MILSSAGVYKGKIYVASLHYDVFSIILASHPDFFSHSNRSDIVEGYITEDSFITRADAKKHSGWLLEYACNRSERIMTGKFDGKNDLSRAQAIADSLNAKNMAKYARCIKPTQFQQDREYVHDAMPLPMSDKLVLGLPPMWRHFEPSLPPLWKSAADNARIVEKAKDSKVSVRGL